jgi:uncharacterized repeat protein (TIGR01451 family)
MVDDVNSAGSAVLANGQVLVVGGYDQSSVTATAQLFDPVTGTWSVTAPLAVARDWPSVAVLQDGRVLVAGGFDNNGNPLSSVEIYDPSKGTWSTASPMLAAGWAMAVATMTDGRVLFAGGDLSSAGSTSVSAVAEIYDPVAGTWTATAPMPSADYSQAAVLLGNGDVLVAGGEEECCGAAVQEALYDPGTGTWSSTGLTNAHSDGSMVVLADGQVLLAGGYTSGTDIYDPASNTWSPGATLPYSFGYEPIALLANGTVLFPSGEQCYWYCTDSIEEQTAVYVPAGTDADLGVGVPTARGNAGSDVVYTVTVTNAGPADATGTIVYGGALPLGETLVSVSGPGSCTALPCQVGDIPAGGSATVTLTAYIDPALSGWSALSTSFSAYAMTWDPNRANNTATAYTAVAGRPSADSAVLGPAMSSPRSWPVTEALADGRALVAGGNLGQPGPSAEVFDPRSDTWSATGPMVDDVDDAAAAVLANGQVLVAGGDDENGVVATAQLFDPASGTWSATGPLAVARWGASLAVLKDGRVLVAGGWDNYGLLSSVEIYDPATGTWSTVNPMPTAGWAMAMTTMPDGRVLAAGGEIEIGNNTMSDTAAAEIYDPVAGTWSATAPMPSADERQAAVLLGNGDVLVAGGEGECCGAAVQAALYDPATGTWSSTGLSTAHTGGSMVVLANGQVLLAGGYTSGTDIYDPASNTWSPGATLPYQWGYTPIALLTNGTVLIAGGTSCWYCTNEETAIYVPAGADADLGVSVPAARGQAGSDVAYTVTVTNAGPAEATGTIVYGGALPLGETLVSVSGPGSCTALPCQVGDIPAGGSATVTLTAYIDPALSGWSALSTSFSAYAMTWDPNRSNNTATASTSVAGRPSADSAVLAARMSSPRYWSVTEPLADGTALVAGGNVGQPGPSAEVFDPRSDTWTATGPMVDDVDYAAGAVLADGQVLVAGGDDENGVVATAQLFDPATGTWSAAAPMAVARYWPSVTVLQDGRVLVAGGYDNSGNPLSSVEIYDPTTGTWSTASPMPAAGGGVAVATLADGRVLFAGGNIPGAGSWTATSAAEIYDPVAGTWTATAPMPSADERQAAVLLGNGDVLVAGGTAACCGSVVKAALYDPGTGTWSSTGLSTAHADGSMIVLANGQVLLAGGETSGTDIYDPASNTWSPGANLPYQWGSEALALLTNGTVLLPGADCWACTGEETAVYVPSGTTADLGVSVSPAGDKAGSDVVYTVTATNAGPAEATGTVVYGGALPLGETLVSVSGPGSCTALPCQVGAIPAGGSATVTLTAYIDPALSYATRLSSSFSAYAMTWDPNRANNTATASTNVVGRPSADSAVLGPPMSSPRYDPVAEALADGRALVAGGNVGQPGPSAEVFDPRSDTWSATGPMVDDVSSAGSAVLANGQVLVVGGYDQSSVTATAQLFDPATGTWSPTAPLSVARDRPSVAVLQDGRVLVAGGFDNNGDPLSSVEIYDPAAGTWSTASPMPAAGWGMAVATMADGRVLFAGGDLSSAGSTSVSAVAEIYDPVAGTWTATAPMPSADYSQAAVLLGNGDVLVAGGEEEGCCGAVQAALYDPGTGTWSSTGPTNAHSDGSMAVLDDGQVLLAGGYTSFTDIYDPASNTWSPGATLLYTWGHTPLARLTNGTVLIAGGTNCWYCTDEETAVYTHVKASPPVQIAVSVTGTQTVGSSSPTFSPSYSAPSGLTLSGTVTCTTVNGGTPIGPSLDAGGSYTIDGPSCSGLTPSGPGEYSVVYVGGPFTVSAPLITVSVTGTQTVGSSSPTFSPSYSAPSGLTLSGTVTCTTVNGGTPIGPSLAADGTYTIDGPSCSGLTVSGPGEYSIVYVGGPFKVSAPLVTVNVSVVGAQTVGSASPTFSPSYSAPSGLTLSGTVTCTTVNGGTPIGPSLAADGTYTIDGPSCSGLTVSGPGEYSIVYVGGPFTVSPLQTPTVQIAAVNGDTGVTSFAAGDVLTITGTNFDPNNPPTTLTFCDSDGSNCQSATLEQVTVDASGHLTCTVVVPSPPSNGGGGSGGGGSGGGGSGGGGSGGGGGGGNLPPITLAPTPGLYLSPYHGAAGTVTTVGVDYLAGSQTVTIEAFASSDASGSPLPGPVTATADPCGCLITSFTVPAGTGSIGAVDPVTGEVIAYARWYPTTITVTVAGSQTYGSSAPSFVPSYSTAPGVGITGTVSCTTVNGGTAISPGLSAAGTYALDGSSCSGLSSSDPTYAIAYVGGFVVSPAVPTIRWATPAAITYGTALGATQLDATANVPGTFSYSPSAGTVPGPGTDTLTAIFSPTDSADYASVPSSTTITVNQATIAVTVTGSQAYGSSAPSFVPSYSAPPGVSITGTLSCTTVDGGTPVSPTLSAAGAYTIDGSSCSGLSSSDPGYALAYSGRGFTVNPATPTITWATPAAITYGTALGATQLDATANVAGTFSYRPGPGTVLKAGAGQVLKVSFVPTDSTDYTGASATTSITVNPATPTIIWAAPAAITYGTALGTTQLDAAANVPGTFSYSPGAGTVLAPGTHTLTATFTPTDTLDYATAVATTSVTVTTGTCITTTDTGSVVVAKGQVLCIGPGGKITGSVTVQAGGAVWGTGGTVQGSLSSSGAVAITLSQVTVGGSLSIAGTTGPLSIGGTSASGLEVITGSVTLTGNLDGASFDYVNLGGSISASGNAGGLTVSGNTIASSVSLSTNAGGVTFTNNTVNGSVSITNNTGGLVYSGNTVKGSVTKSGNS